MTADVDLLPLPEPYGYLRDLDGRLQMSIGPVRPADRAGGCATPWAAMYDPGRVRANVSHATAAKDAEIEALRVDVEAWKASHSMLTDTCHHFQARAERLAEALRLIESAKGRGFGIDYARGVAQSVLRDHDRR